MTRTEMPRGAISPTLPQLQCLQVICEWHDAHGHYPSYREVARELEIPWAANIHWLIRGLEERGWLSRVPHRQRAFRIICRPPMPDFTEITWSLAPDLAAHGQGDRNA